MILLVRPLIFISVCPTYRSVCPFLFLFYLDAGHPLPAAKTYYAPFDLYRRFVVASGPLVVRGQTVVPTKQEPRCLEGRPEDWA